MGLINANGAKIKPKKGWSGVNFVIFPEGEKYHLREEGGKIWFLDRYIYVQPPVPFWRHVSLLHVAFPSRIADYSLASRRSKHGRKYRAIDLFPWSKSLNMENRIFCLCSNLSLVPIWWILPTIRSGEFAPPAEFLPWKRKILHRHSQPQNVNTGIFSIEIVNFARRYSAFKS